MVKYCEGVNSKIDEGKREERGQYYYVQNRSCKSEWMCVRAYERRIKRASRNGDDAGVISARRCCFQYAVQQRQLSLTTRVPLTPDTEGHGRD